MPKSLKILKENENARNEKTLEDLEIIFAKVDDILTIVDISTVLGD